MLFFTYIVSLVVVFILGHGSGAQGVTDLRREIDHLRKTQRQRDAHSFNQWGDGR